MVQQALNQRWQPDPNQPGSGSQSKLIVVAGTGDIAPTPLRFKQTAARLPDHPAYFVRRDGQWLQTTWRGYAEQVQQAARALVALGVQPGQAVCILGFNRPEWAIMDIAAMTIGAVPAGIYWTSSAPEVEYILDHARAPLLLVDTAERAHMITQMRERLINLHQVVRMSDGKPDDKPTDDATLSWEDFLALGRPELQVEVDKRLAAIRLDQPGTYIYTSGTTGPAKAVELSHGNLAWSARALCAALARDGERERVISYLPLAHVAEQMISIHNPALSGFPIYYANKLEELSQYLVEVRPTIFFGVPRVWEKMHSAIEAKLAGATGFKGKLAKWALSTGRRWHDAELNGERPGAWLSMQKKLAHSLVHKKVKAAIGLDQAHMLASGAAPIAAEKLKFFTGLDIVIREVYGQSESSGASTISLRGATRLGSVGRPLDGLDVRIAEDGEILVRGPLIFSGYAGNAAATADTLQDGWLASGDLGHFDKDGYLYITGRKKDLLITSGGKNISPANIEADLMTIPLVEHAVVCGDGKHYLSALLTLNPDTLHELAATYHLSGDKLHEQPAVLAELQRGIDQLNTRHARVANIRKFRIITHSLTIEAGELTPTMKVKRKVVIDRFKDLVDEMYAEPLA
jgi:long-chain acyl-CoA synthetase